ncbi:PREDICTED: uncharacterized protein LOC105448741 [Wasmannia auropunctata]|uniref:uncharacterized protein LOC105448741 n=1 Tax=Wasmannia auropunctata TaxID=64793 RepID=UPI0005EF61D8|nr:PREDICTED: uncharacterized protein LOC105448741 [Wasmannia auropunctata]
MINDELYLLREAYHELQNPFLLTELKALKQQHLGLSDTVGMMKTVFSWQLISTIIMTFIQITVHLYYSLVQVVQGVNLNNHEKQYYSESYTSSIPVVTYYSIKLLLIIWACQSAKSQAVEINTTVLHVFNSINDKEIKYELRLFSLQLMHHKIMFSATGFSVDATLLVTMIDIIVTYLLILIQFVFMSNSCDGEASTCFKQINDSLMNFREFMTNGELYFLRRPYHKLKNPFLLTELKALKQQHLGLSDTACFKRINDNLEHMQELITDDEVYHLGKMYQQRSLLLLTELKALKKQHQTISNTVQMLNMIFSLQLLISIIITFGEITFLFYFHILYWQSNISMINVDDNIYTTFMTMCITYYFTKILLMVWACATGKDQALQIGTTVHDVLNITGDKKIKSEAVPS